jgi:hypothetical protein
MKCHRRTGSGVLILQEALLSMPLGVVSECEIVRATQRNPLRQTDSRELTSEFEPLTCSLRVCGQWLLSCGFDFLALRAPVVR